MHRYAPLLALLLLSAITLSQGDSGKDKPAADKDYAAELPRIPPKEPAEALKTFQLRPGFRIELAAAEPLLRSPVAIDFDENGRMFVAEYPEYNQYASKKSHGRGCIRLLEDTDGDGRFDKSTVYVDDLDSPVAVACWDGGVFVGAVPDILYCKDTDGDGKADVRKPVFTGFGRDAAGEAMLNSFRWGLDNRFHLSTGYAPGSVRRADRPDDRPVAVRGQGFLFDPRPLTLPSPSDGGEGRVRGGGFELISGGGQHGMSMDDWGRKFVCANSDPAHLIMYDSRYLARNPYLQAPAAAVNIAPEGKYTKLFRVSPVEPWRELRTRLRREKIIPGSDEGGEPSGFFTGATGITVYRGDAWPAEYRGNLFVGEVANNLVYRARLEPDGVGFKAVRADKDVEFLASRDIWFRPVQFANGPDGCLYVIDMYRELIEGAAFLPPQILKHLDPSSGVDRGRIYRIVPVGFKRPPPPRLGKASTAELVALLEHANGWHRDTASRLLYQRQDPAAVAPLKKLAAESKSPLGRLHALYALDGMAALEPALVLRALNDPEPRVREHAVRLAERFAATPQVQARLEQMTDDPDLRVRYQLAFSLGAVKGEMPTRALVRLMLRDGGDPWVRLAVLSSVSERAGEVFRLLLADRAFRAAPHGRSLLAELAGQVGAAGRANDLTAVIKSLDDLPQDEKALAQAIVRGLANRPSPAAREQLNGAAGSRVKVIFAELLRDARQTAADDKRTASARTAAIRTLGLADFAEVRELFGQLLQLRQPQPVQLAALETLARFDRAEVPALILEAWPTLSPQLRATAAETLFSRPAWVAAFLDAVEQGKVARGDVDPARIQLLQAYSDEKVRARAARVFAGTGPARRQEVVDAYQKALQLPGDAARGKQVFAKECSACHRLEGVGHNIGADLSAVRDRGLDAVLLNILDPNREVKPQFLSYVLATRTGRVITGMITAETATSITIRRADGTSETILRLDIEELRSTGLSFMPEGLEKQIDVQAMADLLAYLNSIK
ncbi:MAG TPA: PVC-type heme-binding CxxCH protein [Gemmataceae bacterium]|nr:PVC-type heme-binding CxxCH protein [Gemmataceae bacterium]